MPTAHCLHTPGGPLKYSLEGHQFAVFGVCLTSDARFVVSVSNKFLIWDLSTSDLTRAVNPGVEGVFQGLVLSPDDRFAAAWTNNSQTILLNLLTSEQVVIDNPLPEGEAVRGACLLDTHCILYGQSQWKLLTLQGQVVESRQETFSPLPGSDVSYQILLMDFRARRAGDYHVIFWTGKLEDKRLILQSIDQGQRINPLQLHGALVMNRKREVLYACSSDASNPDTFGVSVFKLTSKFLPVCFYFNSIKFKTCFIPDAGQSPTRKGILQRQGRVNENPPSIEVTEGSSDSGPAEWVKIGSLPIGESLLQLSLSENENFLLGTTALGFCIWNVSGNADGQQRTDLKLPTGVRNISVRLLHSNSVMLSKGEEFAVAGVRSVPFSLPSILKLRNAEWSFTIISFYRKNLYVWKTTNGELVKVLDAHFGRILSIVPYTIGPWNSVKT